MDISKNTLLTQLLKKFVFSQVDTEGYEYILLQEIYDHQKDGLAVAKDGMLVQHTRGGSNAVHRRTMKGWQLLVQWKGGSTSWTLLKDLKESNPVEVAEYAVANKVANEPVFILSGGLKMFLDNAIR